MAKVNRMWPTEWPKAQSTVNGTKSGHGQAGMEELEFHEEPFAVLWPKQSVDHDPVTQPWVAATSARFDIMAPIRSPHLPPPPPKRILFCIHQQTDPLGCSAKGDRLVLLALLTV